VVIPKVKEGGMKEVVIHRGTEVVMKGEAIPKVKEVVMKEVKEGVMKEVVIPKVKEDNTEEIIVEVEEDEVLWNKMKSEMLRHSDQFHKILNLIIKCKIIKLTMETDIR